MMSADVTIGNPETATLYGLPTGQRIRVRKEQELLIVLTNTTGPQLTWGTTSPDNVLDLREQTDPNRATVRTTSSGTSKILLLNGALKAEFFIEVEVFDPEQATDLGLAAGAVEQK